MNDPFSILENEHREIGQLDYFFAERKSLV